MKASASDPLTALRAARARRFRAWVTPYLRLAGSSLPGMLFACLVALLLYNRMVDGLSDAFPAVYVVSAILTYAASSVWIRTYLEQADLVYLLPLEHRMGGYLSAAVRSSLIVQVVKMSAFWALLWQLYQVSPQAQGRLFLPLLGILIVIKLLGVFFWWSENNMRNRRTRLIFTFIRVLLAFAFIHAALTLDPQLALLLIGLASIGYVGLLRLPERAEVAWERHIARERRRMAQWRTVLNQFVEVAGDQPVVRASPFARLAAFIPHRKRRAYHYVFLLVWSRSPISGMTVRLWAAGCLIGAIAGELWLKAGVFALFAYLLRLQLAELVRAHAYDDWSFALPIGREAKPAAAKSVARSIWIASVCLLALVYALTF